jgi:hypothetical protein
MPKAEIEKKYHPNGQLRWQATIKNGKPFGMVRHWHENGVLKEECPCDDEGLEHGIVKNWNKHGVLLGECSMDHGTGVIKSWYENDQLESESYYIRGKCCGRSRMWWEDGTLMSVNYHLEGKNVAKKKYIEACKKDSALPCYEDDHLEPKEPKISGTYQKRKVPASEWDRYQHGEFIKKFMRKPNRGEARQWLRGDENRCIGEMTHEDSVEFIEEGYGAGATKIIAVEIEGETTNCLIVELPSARARRERVFEWNSEFAQKTGWDPYDDWGQNELFVYFS